MLNRFGAFVTGITACYKYIQRIKSLEMTELGLRGTHAMCLFFLHSHPEGLTAAQLSQLCAEDKAAVSRIIGEMESKGLLQKINDGTSQYRARISLTPAGEKAAAFVRERASAAVELAGSGLSDEDRKAFYKTLELISENLQEICKKGIP